MYADSERSSSIRKTSIIRTSHPFAKMADSDEPMEVTLCTEVEPNAKGFTIVGGGTEGIIVSQVTKHSPQSNIFCIKEGDQLLSATIYFDNMTYEDAIKILQHSESYRVEFQLKRKLGKEDREKIQSIAQLKKEKTSQDKDDSTIVSEKIEEHTVRRRENKKKRSKKDRLSWPKFQSLTNTRFLGHRRSRSTSETNEDETLDISSKVTEANLDDDELFVTEEEKPYRQGFSGSDIHSGVTTIDQQRTGVKTKKEPHDRSKEKRSLDSSICVQVERHDLPKTQMKKGLSLHSTISSSSRETGSLERKNLHPDVEVIIVKEKNLPSPCKVSPIHTRYERISKENLSGAATKIPITHLTTKEEVLQPTMTSEGQHVVSDDTSSPTTEEPSGNKQRRNKKKKKMGKSIEILQEQKRTQESSFSMDVDKEHFTGNFETQFKADKGEKVSTDFTLLEKPDYKDVLVEKNIAAVGVEELPDDSDIKLQLPIFKGPSFVVSEQQESNLTFIESSAKQAPPDQQSEVLGWKLQMPIIKMPKLPKLYRKSLRSESEEPLDAANMSMLRKDSSVDTDGQIAPQAIPFSVQMEASKDRTVTTDSGQNVLVTHAKVIADEKLHMPKVSLQKGDLDASKPEAVYGQLQHEQEVLTGETGTLAPKSFDDYIRRPDISGNVFQSSEGNKPARDISTKLIFSTDEVTEFQDKDSIGVDLEYKMKDNEDEQKESILKMPRFKLPSFGSLTKRATYSTDGKMEVKEDHIDIRDEDGRVKHLDVKDSDHKDIQADNLQTTEYKSKMKLPKVGVSLPKLKGHKGHYTVDTHIQYANNELEYERFQITADNFEKERKKNILDTDEQDLSKDISTDITKVQSEKSKMTLPYFQLPKLGLAKYGDAEPEETNNIISETTENVGYEDISAAEEPRGNKDSKSWKIQMPFIKIPKMGTSERITVDTSTSDQATYGIDGKEVAMETSVSSEMSDVTQKVDGHFKIPTFKIPPFKKKGGQYGPKEDTTAEVEISITDKADSWELPEPDTQEISKKTELTSEESDIEKYGSPFKLPSVKLPSFSMSGLRGRLSREETDMEKLHPVLEQADYDNNLKDVKVTKSKKKKKVKTKTAKADSQVENQEASETKTVTESTSMSVGLDDKDKSGFDAIKKPHVKVKMPRIELYRPYTTQEKLDLQDVDQSIIKVDSDLKDEEVKVNSRDTKEFKETILTTYISTDLPEIHDSNIYSDNRDIKQKEIKVKTLLEEQEKEAKTISIEQKPKTTKTKKSKKKSRKVSQTKKLDLQEAKKQQETDSSGETQSDDMIVGDSPDEDRGVTEEEFKYSEGSKSKGYLAKIKMPKLEFVGTSRKFKHLVKHTEDIDAGQTMELTEPAAGHILEPHKCEDFLMENIIDLTGGKDYHITREENTEESSNKIEFPNYQMQTISLKIIQNKEQQTGRIDQDQENQMIYSSSLDASVETSGEQETSQMDFTHDGTEKTDKTSTSWKFQLPSIKRPSFGRKGDKNKTGETITVISLEASKAGESFQKDYEDDILISKEVKRKVSSDELEHVTPSFQKHVTQEDYPTTDDNIMIEENKTGKKTIIPKIKLPKFEFSTVFNKESKAKIMEKEPDISVSEQGLQQINDVVANGETTLIVNEGQQEETVLSVAKDSTKQAVGEMNYTISKLSTYTDFEKGKLERETKLPETKDQTKNVFLKSSTEITSGEKIKIGIKEHDTEKDLHLTSAENKWTAEKEKEEKDSTQVRVTVKAHEKGELTRLEKEPGTVDENVKTKDVFQQESTKETSAVVKDVKEVSFGWKLPTFKVPLFSATDVTIESFVDEPRETAPETIAETTLHKSTKEIITAEIEKTKYEAYPRKPTDSIDMAYKKEEISVSEGEMEVPTQESESWRLPSSRLQPFSLFGTSEIQIKDTSKDISRELTRKTTTETDVVKEARTTIGEFNETTKSIKRLKGNVQSAENIMERAVMDGQEKILEEKESAWAISLPSQTDSIVSKSSSSIADIDRPEKVIDIITEKIREVEEPVHLESALEVALTEGAESVRTGVVVEKAYTEEEKSEASEESPTPKESDTHKEHKVDVEEIVTEVVDVDKESPTEGVKVKGKVRKHKKKITKVVKTITTEQTTGIEAISPTLEFHSTTPSIQTVGKMDEEKEVSPQTLKSELDLDSTEKIISMVQSSQGEKISSKSGKISKFSKLGVSVLAESINISSEDRVDESQLSERDSVSARKLKSLREGKVKFYSTDLSPSHQESAADLQASDLSVLERRRRIIFPQLSLPEFGITVLQESISIADENSPTINISFTDKIQRSPEAANVSLPQKEEGRDDISTFHMTMVSDAKEAQQDANIELQLNKDIMKTIESINFKVQQLKLVDEEYEYPEKKSLEFQIPKVSSDTSITKTRLGTDDIHEPSLLSQGIIDQVLSADESEVTFKISDVIPEHTSKPEERLHTEHTESKQDDSLHVSIVAQSPGTDSTRIHFPRFSTPKLSVAVMGESIHMGDDEPIHTKLDYSLLEENAQTQLSTEKEIIKTGSDASESSAWKFQMPNFKMNIFGKTDKKSDTSLDSGRTENENAGSVLQEDAENNILKADQEKQPPVEEKPRSPFKLPSLKLPSLSLRGKKGKISIDLPDDQVAIQEELPVEREKNKDADKLENVEECRIETENVKIGLITKDDQAKIKLPKLEFSKPSMKVSKGSTNLVAESLDANISEITESKYSAVEGQVDASKVSPVSPGVQKIEKSEIHVEINHELAEEIKIEFPYFKTPVISAIIPQDVTLETADSSQDLHEEVHTTEINAEHAISRVYKTPLRKTEAIDMSGHIPEAENPEFASEELKDISISSQQDASGSQIKSRKAIKLSFSKVKMPVLTLSAPREKEYFDITIRHDGSGLDLPEYDLSSKEELPAVDITCVANQSVQNIIEALESSETADIDRSETDQISPHEEEATATEKGKNRENAEAQLISTFESVSLTEQEKLIKIQTETAPVDSSTSITKSQPVEKHETVKLSHISYVRFGAPSPDAPTEAVGKSDIELYSDSSSGDIHSEYDNVSPDPIKPKSKIIESSSFSSGIVKEYEISTSEVPAYGFSILKVKLPEVSTSINTKDSENLNTEAKYQGKTELSEEINTEASQSFETRLEKSKDELIKSDLSLSPKVHIEKLKTFTVEMKSPTHTTTMSFPIHAKDLEVSLPETSERLAPKNQEEQMSIKEKEALQKSPSKFRFWIPNIGFSTSVDEGESKKAEQQEQKTEVSKPEKEALPSSKEKLPWYKFPKLGFSSSEKQKSEDKETVNRPQASTNVTEPENIEVQTPSVVQSGQASLAEPEDFKVNETDLDENETKSTK